MRQGFPATELGAAVRKSGVAVLHGHTVVEAVPGSGMQSVTGVNVAAIVAEGRVGAGLQFVKCDLLCMSVGYTPAAQLSCHSGARMQYDESAALLMIDDSSVSPNSLLAGSVNAVFGLSAVESDGVRVGNVAAGLAGCDVSPETAVPDRTGAGVQNHPWPIFAHPKGKEFVDEFLQSRDIERAVAEGYDDLDLVKRYSTVVMGPSQGRQSALTNLPSRHEPRDGRSRI